MNSEIPSMNYFTQITRNSAKAVRRIFRAASGLGISRILNDERSPDTKKAERSFDKLQNEFNPLPEYGYGNYDIWKRACERSTTLIGLEGIERGGASLLEIGAGDGMLGVALSSFGHNVTLFDQVDWRCTQAKSLEMLLAPPQPAIPLADAGFDLIYSFNTFEHLEHPEEIFQEIVRLAKPGGWIYLHFGPLYDSPWGLHAYRTLRMPYPQFLFSEDFIDRKLQHLGIHDLGSSRNALQYLNKRKILDFKQVFSNPSLQSTINYNYDHSYLGLIRRFPDSFRGRNLHLNDLVTSHIELIARKNDGR